MSAAKGFSLFKSPLFWILAVIAVGVGSYFLFFKKKTTAAGDTTFKNVDSEPNTVILKKGVSGTKVTELQKKIKAVNPQANLGSGGPQSDGVDGLFGDSTATELAKLKVPDSTGTLALGKTEVPYDKIGLIVAA